MCNNQRSSELWAGVAHFIIFFYLWRWHLEKQIEGVHPASIKLTMMSSGMLDSRFHLSSIGHAKEEEIYIKREC